MAAASAPHTHPPSRITSAIGDANGFVTPFWRSAASSPVARWRTGAARKPGAGRLVVARPVDRQKPLSPMDGAVPGDHWTYEVS